MSKPERRHVPFYRHDLGQAEIESLTRVLAQPILTTGDVVEEFERRFAALLGARHAIGVTSCTGGMHIALEALGVGRGDEVITTPMTFIATATAIVQAGAKPVFVDVERDTGNIDASLVEAAITPRTRAILPVHLFGQMCDMRALRAIADKHALRLVEDCAHCVEGARDGVRPGQLSDAAAFSFFATKNLTCGEGGAVTVNDEKLYFALRLLRHHGMDKTSVDRHREGYKHWDMPVFGWKYNMSNIEAAILLPQFERLAGKLARREALAGRYARGLEGIDGLIQVPARPASIHARHLLPVLVENRDEVIAALRARGVETVVNYRPVHLTTYFSQTFGHQAGRLPQAEWFGERCLSLPFYPTMDEKAVDYVCEMLREVMATARRPVNPGPWTALPG